MINVDLLLTGNAFWASLANHLWQSTLFAGAAWLLTLFLKKNRARIRYWIWFSVSIKFLIPFSLIVSLGSLISPEWVKTPIEIPPQWNIIHRLNQPFDAPDLRVAAPTIDIKKTSPESDIIDASYLSDKVPAIIFFFWLCGSLALLLSWNKRGMKISRIARNAGPFIDNHTIEAFHRMKQKHRVSNIVQLVSTRDLMEPGVYGILRPVLLLPAGIMKHINNSELEAIFLHEFEHIRCRDNLIALIHMIVQALFWFHPVVWLTGSRLVFERELACDEAVLQAAKNPQAYAEGILKVCEYCLKSPLVCVSGVIGSNLKKRMEGIMKNQIGHKLSIMKRFLLSFAGLLVFCIPLALGIINAPDSQARSFDNSPDKYTVDEYKPDTYQESESHNKSSEIINEKQVHDNLSVVLNEGTKLKPESSGGHILKNKNHAIVMANAGVRTAVKNEKKAVSFKAAPETVSKNNETRIVLAKREVPVKVTSDKGSNDVKLKTEDAKKYISRGIAFLKKGQIEDAVSSFDKAIDLEPGNAVAYVARGSIYFRLGRFDKALSDFNRAIEIKPDLAAAYQNRGSVYYRQGKFDKALLDYNRVIKMNPDFAFAYLDRGNIYQSQGRFDNAISDYNRVIDINPDIAAAYKNRGNAYYRKGKFYKAISDYSKALKFNPDDAEIYTNRGMAYLSEKEYRKALKELNKAIELNPEFTNAYIDRGTCYNYLRQVDKAAADYKKALELNPNSALSKEMTEYCEQVKINKNRFRWAMRGSSVVPGGQNVAYGPGTPGPGAGGYTGLENRGTKK